MYFCGMYLSPVFALGNLPSPPLFGGNTEEKSHRASTHLPQLSVPSFLCEIHNAPAVSVTNSLTWTGQVLGLFLGRVLRRTQYGAQLWEL